MLHFFPLQFPVGLATSPSQVFPRGIKGISQRSRLRTWVLEPGIKFILGIALAEQSQVAQHFIRLLLQLLGEWWGWN